MRSLLMSVGFPQTPATLLLCDNQGAITLVSNLKFHRRTKHIDVKYHFTRENLDTQFIRVDFVNKGPRFSTLRKCLGIM